MTDASRLHPPTHRPPEEAADVRPPDVDLAPWEPPVAEEEAVRDAGPEARPAPPRPEPSGRPTPPLELPLPVLVLTEQARRVSDEERPEVARKLNAQLEVLGSAGGGRPEADVLHRLLESGKLEGLVDGQGRSCRAVAVEALLGLGFPYALEVRPEDLEHLRASGGDSWRTRMGPAVPGAVLLTGLVAQLGQELARSSGPDSLVTTQVGLSALALVALWLAPTKSPVYRVGLVLLTLATFLGLVAPLFMGGPVGPWAILGGLVAGLLAALRES